MAETRGLEERDPSTFRFDGQVWAPGTFTPPLSEDFPTLGDALLKFVDLAWRAPETVGKFQLDDWQRTLIRHVLEVFPEGHPRAGQLRYRQVVISLGRQNGKSVLGAILGLFGLVLSGPGPEVISIASTVEQANIVFKRVKHVIDSNSTLSQRFRTSSTRGITSTMPGRAASYVVKTNKEASLQGIPVRLCVFDEVHICPPESWDAVVFGTSAQINGLVLGITTAGDQKSVLLKRLYEVGRKAAALEDEHDERFGFFLWEAAAHLRLNDPEFLIQANPSIACGRLPLDQELNAIKSMPENQVRRYRGNQFVSSESAWLPSALWFGAPKGETPAGRPVVFSVARALNWRAATIIASVKGPDGRVWTEVVASLVNPTLDQLEELCHQLWRTRKPLAFLMEAADLKDLAMRLRERGVTTEYLTTAQMMNVCATAYALISEGKVGHADDWVVNTQMPKAVSKNIGDGWRISRRDSIGDVDAVMATVIGLYGAETLKAKASALFVG